MGCLGSRIMSVIFGFFFRLLQSFVYWLLKQIKGSQQGTLPAITDHTLLEPAIVLAAKIRTGKLKSETVVRAYIDRIKAVNPMLNALVEDRFEAALEDAKAADAYVQTSGKTADELAREKPFLGVPFTAKVSVAIKDLDLSSGVIARKGIKASEDCPVVTNMRNAGAIPLCVTNVPELCMWGDTSNKLFGVTNNPYDLTRIPGGSSGGEGALVSSAASIIGLGNDLGGSIRYPSYCCGIFGHKPTKRVLSNEGQFPCSYKTDLDEMNCTGPMCRYACDLIPVLKVLGADEAVAKLKLEEQVDLKNLKVYYTEDYIDNALTPRMDPELKECVRKIIKHLERTYGIQATKVSIPHLSSVWSIWMAKIFTAKTPAPLTDFATEKPGQFNLFLEFVKWIFGRCNHTFYLLHMFGLGAFYTSPFMKKKLEGYMKLYDSLVEFFNNLLKSDGIFIMPTSAHTTPFHQEQSLKMYSYAYTGIFSILGYPVTQCPTGLSSEGLPLGVQVTSNLLNDRLTLAVAQEIEQLFGGWKSPSAIL